MSRESDEYYRRNYDNMADVEVFGDTLYMKAQFLKLGCNPVNERYINDIHDLCDIQRLINTKLSYIDNIYTEAVSSREIDKDFLTDTEKEFIINSINDVIKQKIQLREHYSNMSLFNKK